MYALEDGRSYEATKLRRRHRNRYIAIALIRSVFREVCSCLRSIFVLELNFVHTTETSLNPTNVVLVNVPQAPPHPPRQRSQITELPSSDSPDVFETTPNNSGASPQISEELPLTGEDLLQTMITVKNSVLEYVQDEFKSVAERVTPALSKLGLLTMAFCLLWHQTLTQLIFYPLFRLLFGTLYPAYASYKAVKTKNVREYVKWMMYWIVFALFTCAETFTDVFLSWFPFYYEIKIILVIWLLSPATKGSSILYRKFVHPMLSSREQEIDEYISKAKEQSYKQVLDLGSKGVNALMQTAIKGGGGLVNQIRKSYSLSDLSEQRHEREYDGSEETDSLGEPRVIRRRHSPRRHSPRRHTTTSAIYFSEIDVRHDMLGNIQTVEDISSGYSSGEIVHAGHPPKLQGREGLVRTGSIGSSKLKPTRVTRASVPKKSTEDLEYNLEYPIDSKESVIYLNDKAQFLHDLDDDGQKTKMSESTSSEEEFRDCIEQDGNVDFSPHNTLNFPQTFDTEVRTVMHENLECSVQPYKSIPLKDSDNEKNFLQIENEELDIKITSFSDYKQCENKITETGRQNENETNMESKDLKKEARGGKYNKHVAPLPPSDKKLSEFDLSAIKATLILKPGIVKSIGLDSSKNEIFCHSPKLKRRSLNVSSSNSSSSSRELSGSPNRPKSKLDASLSRLKMLPRKMNFWHKDDTAIEQKKRTSWYDTLEPPEISKELSKSDDDISKLRAREKLLKRIETLTNETGTLENK